MNLLREFLTISTIHGFAHIGSAKSWVTRIFWVVIVGASFGAAIYLINSSYTEWVDSPVSSMTTTRPISELEFPEVTVCPPKGLNTVLNLVLEKVKDEKQTPGLKEKLKHFVHSNFVDKPSKMFARDMTHLMNIQSLKDLFEGRVSIPEKNTFNSFGENQITIKTSLPNGSFSTPGYNKEYQSNFYNSYGAG